MYELEDESIRKNAPCSRGIYLLGNIEAGKFVVRYVGRSDSSIRSRLLNHEHKDKFSFFEFQVTRTKREAFLLETENFYLHRESIINKIHPNMPENLLVQHPCDALGKKIKRGVANGKKRGC